MHASITALMAASIAISATAVASATTAVSDAASVDVSAADRAFVLLGLLRLTSLGAAMAGLAASYSCLCWRVDWLEGLDERLLGCLDC